MPCSVSDSSRLDNGIDASVPEFAISTSTSTSTKNIQYSISTDQILTVPVLVPVQQIFTKNAAKFENFERKISFSSSKFKFRGAILNFEWKTSWPPDFFA